MDQGTEELEIIGTHLTGVTFLQSTVSTPITEETEEADLLLHVIDITHEKAAEQAMIVDKILKDLDFENKPKILVLNKCDQLNTDLIETSNNSHIPVYLQTEGFPNVFYLCLLLHQEIQHGHPFY